MNKLLPIAAAFFATASVALGASQEPPTTQPATTQPEVKQAKDGMPQPLDPTTDTPGLEVGTEAPDATMHSLNGEEVQLADLYKDGPVVVTFYRGKW